MANISKICQCCSEKIAINSIYISINAQNNGYINMIESSLYLHIDCFVEMAGDEFCEVLLNKIKTTVKEQRKKRESLLKRNNGCFGDF